MLTNQQIRDEVSNDPLSLGYAGKTPRQIADIGNAKVRTLAQPLTVREVMRWAASGPMIKLMDGRDLVTNSDIVRSACAVFLKMIESFHVGWIDPHDSDFVSMMSPLVPGVLSSQDISNLRTLSDSKSASRFEELSGTPGLIVSSEQIAIALRG